MPHSIDIGDLVQDGVLGLIDAAQRFDDARGIKFETFAERRVRGAMIDALRREAWPRGVRRQRRELGQERHLARRCHHACQLQQEEAGAVAVGCVNANLAGHDSHGVGMVMPYVRSLKAGELQLNQRLSIVTDAGTLLVADGNRGIGQSMAFQTMQLAIERARRSGVVIVGLRNSHHIGRVGHWAEQAIADA